MTSGTIGTAGGAAAQHNTRRRRGTRISHKSPVLTIGMLLCAAYFLLPLLWLLISTTKSDGALFSTFGIAPGSLGQLGRNLASVFTTNGGEFGVWLLNTAIYGVSSAFGAAILSTLAGYALSKYRFAGRRAVISIILGAVLIPGTALAIPTYFLFASAGITNTPWAVILPSIVNPFGVFLMWVYADESVDDALLESGRIDGAGELRIFTTISARLLSPAIVTVFLLALVASWNNYLLPLIMLNRPNLFPVTVGLSAWLDASNNAGGTRIAISTLLTGALVSIVPLVIAFLALQRYWQAGLTTGSVKG